MSTTIDQATGHVTETVNMVSDQLPLPLDPMDLLSTQCFQIAMYALSQCHLFYHATGPVPDAELYEFALDALQQCTKAHAKAFEKMEQRRADRVITPSGGVVNRRSTDKAV